MPDAGEAAPAVPPMLPLQVLDGSRPPTRRPGETNAMRHAEKLARRNIARKLRRKEIHDHLARLMGGGQPAAPAVARAEFAATVAEAPEDPEEFRRWYQRQLAGLLTQEDSQITARLSVLKEIARLRDRQTANDPGSAWNRLLDLAKESERLGALVAGRPGNGGADGLPADHMPGAVEASDEHVRRELASASPLPS